MFDLSPSMVWLILLVIFILTEIATVGLLTIWFAGGSLAAFFCQSHTGRHWDTDCYISDRIIRTGAADSAISSEKIQFRSYPHECPDTDR